MMNLFLSRPFQNSPGEKFEGAAEVRALEKFEGAAEVRALEKVTWKPNAN
jgi:hypothetical protein